MLRGESKCQKSGKSLDEDIKTGAAAGAAVAVSGILPARSPSSSTGGTTSFKLQPDPRNSSGNYYCAPESRIDLDSKSAELTLDP
jgi:hypothetical protein